jgi:hypothetical protein
MFFAHISKGTCNWKKVIEKIQPEPRTPKGYLSGLEHRDLP